MKKIIMSVLAISLFSPVYAALECRSNVCTDIQGLDDIVVIPTGEDLFGSSVRELKTVEEYCAVVFGEQNNQPIPYDVQFRTYTGMRVQSDGRFKIAGGPVFTLKWRGNPDSPFRQIDTSQLTEDTPGATNCNDKNAQAAIQVSINTDELRAVSPGVYSGQMSMDMGQESTLYHQAVNFNIILPQVVKISGLDDMAFTTGDRRQAKNGTTFFRKDERFCVFVWGGGDYSISADSNTGNDFLLTNGNETIQYIVRLSQSDDGSGLKTVKPNESVTSKGGSASIDCNGGDNARVRIRINGIEVDGKSAGAYNSTLTLTVRAL